MKKLADLTPEEFLKLLSEFHAAPERRSKMTMTEIKELAIRLNKKINVPLIRETGEEKILIKVVLKIDRFLYDHLPNEFYDLIRSADKGIHVSEAKRLIRRLSNLANEKINIPYIPEIMEKIAMQFVIGIVIRAAVRNVDLLSSLEQSDNYDGDWDELKLPVTEKSGVA